MKRFYYSIPVFIQNLLVSIYGLYLQKKRLDKGFEKSLSFSLEREKLSKKDLFYYQQNKIKNTLINANRNSVFYRDLFKKYGIRLEGSNIDYISELKKLPVITKENIRDLDVKLNDKVFKVSTSGSTGAGLQFYQTREAINDQWAVWWRYRSWHNIDLGDWCALFSGKRIVPGNSKGTFWRYNIPGRQILFSIYHLTDVNAREYAKKIRTSKVPWIHGYPSALSLLAKYGKEQNLNFGDHLRIITIGSETLLPEQKKLMEDVFKVPVRQHYGLAEGVANISECEYGSLHVDEDFSYVEFIKIDDSNNYKIIGTNFNNTAFPLIRYDTKDIISNLSKGCKCGRASRIVGGIDGRIEDYITLTNGRKVGRIPGVFVKRNEITEAQIEQFSTTDIQINIVKNSKYTLNTEKLLKRDLETLIEDNSVSIRFKYVDKIEKGKNGKLRFVKSHI